MPKNIQKKPRGKSLSLLFILLTLVLSIVCWLNFGPLLSLLIGKIPLFETARWSAVGDYLIVNTPFILLILALFFSIRVLIGKPFLDYASDAPHFRFGIFFPVLFVFLGFMALLSLLQSGSIHLANTKIKDMLILLPFVLVITPLQCLGEEYLFRILPYRIFRLYRNEIDDVDKAVLVLLSGAIFLIPHLSNGEMKLSASTLAVMIYYFAWGALAMVLALKTGGFEAPIAMHVANNLYIALFVSYPGCSLPSLPLCMKEQAPGNAELLIELFSSYALIFYFVSLWQNRILSTNKGNR